MSDGLAVKISLLPLAEAQEDAISDQTLEELSNASSLLDWLGDNKVSGVGRGIVAFETSSHSSMQAVT